MEKEKLSSDMEAAAGASDSKEIGRGPEGTNAMLQADSATGEEADQMPAETVETEETVETAVETEAATIDDEVIESTSMHAAIKQKFIEGGAGFMACVVLCLIFGLAISIERVIYLNLADTNTKKFIAGFEDALNNGGLEAAKEFCRNTRGPVASIFYQGLCRYDQGIDMVEKSVVSYGSVQMGLLEKGLTWVGLFIALALQPALVHNVIILHQLSLHLCCQRIFIRMKILWLAACNRSI